MGRASNSQFTILWVQVCGLAFVQGAIALLWVIYNLYLPALLEQLGFPKALTVSLLVVENLLAVVMEPLMGGLSDRTQRWVGTRFPMIAVGVVLSSALFISLPAIALFGSATSVWRWVLPAAAVAWALAMTVFRSPALALLGRYAFATQLPQAASILTLIGALVGATGAFAQSFLLSLGPAVAFATGSLVLLAAATVLRSVNAPLTEPAAVQSEVIPSISLSKLALTFGTGSGITLGFLLLRGILSADQTGAGMLATFTIAHLVTIIPAGLIAVRFGNQRVMLLGLGGMAIATSTIGFTHTESVILITPIILGTAFSFIANGVIPFALAAVPPARAGLGTGIYFGGAALAGSLFGAIAPSLANLPLLTRSSTSALGFLLAAVCVALASKLPLSPQKLR